MLDPASLDAFMDSGAALLGIPLDPAWRPSVRGHLEVSLRLALLVAEFPLPGELDPAPVFRA